MRSYPVLLLDDTKCRENIRTMAAKARQRNLIFRPHFKTHQSLAIGEWFRDAGVNSITVSSVQMAEYFAQGHWNDITVAFPVSYWEVEHINNLSKRVSVNVLTPSASSLMKVAALIDKNVGIFIEVDVGHERSGVNPENTREVAIMVNLIEKANLKFKGFLTHAGHTYQAKSPDEVLSIHNNAMGKLARLKLFWKESHPNILVSYGDTPSCAISDDFWGIDEIRPGNFVFFDVMQNHIGSCKPSNIALSVVCPVVDINRTRGEALVHCGAVHLSKDFLHLPSGEISFGAVCTLSNTVRSAPIDGLYLKSLSQEHGIIASVTGSFPFEIGDLLAILPIHSCLTVDLMGEMVCPDGTIIPTMHQRTFH